jgi:hypothetical protein
MECIVPLAYCPKHLMEKFLEIPWGWHFKYQKSAIFGVIKIQVISRNSSLKTIK